MGYTTVAYNYIVHTKYDPAIQKNPFSGTPPFPKLDPRTRKSYGVESYREGIKQLTRLTVVLDNDQAIKSGSGFVSANALALQRYDLLSVTPTTEMAFQHACITLSELKPFSVDIISLDLAVAPRLPFHLKRSTVGAALSNGVVFEITYGAAIDAKSSSLSSKSTSEMPDLSDARRNLFSGAREILRVTNGKGVILSSQAMDAMGLRAPYDVMNLATLMGMSSHGAKDAISVSCQSLILRALTRQTFRGALSKPYVLKSEEETRNPLNDDMGLESQSRSPISGDLKKKGEKRKYN